MSSPADNQSIGQAICLLCGHRVTDIPAAVTEEYFFDHFATTHRSLEP